MPASGRLLLTRITFGIRTFVTQTFSSSLNWESGKSPRSKCRVEWKMLYKKMCMRQKWYDPAVFLLWNLKLQQYWWWCATLKVLCAHSGPWCRQPTNQHHAWTAMTINQSLSITVQFKNCISFFALYADFPGWKKLGYTYKPWKDWPRYDVQRAWYLAHSDLPWAIGIWARRSRPPNRSIL